MRPKLITPSARKSENVEIVCLSAIDRLLGRKGVVNAFAGRTVFTDAVIQMGKDVGIGHRMAPILFGTELYIGLVPHKYVGDTTYVCAVANIETVLIGE